MTERMTEEERRIWEHVLDRHFTRSAEFIFAPNDKMASMHAALHGRAEGQQSDVTDLDLDAIKARLELLETFQLATDCRALVAEVERVRAERDEARGALWRACHDAWSTADAAMRHYLDDARAALHPQEPSDGV